MGSLAVAVWAASGVMGVPEEARESRRHTSLGMQLGC